MPSGSLPISTAIAARRRLRRHGPRSILTTFEDEAASAGVRPKLFRWERCSILGRCEQDRLVSKTRFTSRVNVCALQLTYGTAGVGSVGHLATVMVDDAAKAQMTHVPYKGAANAAQDLAAGQIELKAT